MKKTKYVQPAVEVTEVKLENALMAMSAPGSGISWGGNAGDNGTPDPEAKDGGAWNIWN